jgi:DNA-binding MarR family transcriptional regulator
MLAYNSGMEKIKLPRKPRILKKEQAPDLRQFAVLPIRAITDRKLTEMQLRTLLMFCAYSNRGGLTWVGLKRIADHFGNSLNATSQHTRALIAKGYIKVLYHGYKGERAHTRQIIFRAGMKLEDIIAISGESAPYLQQDQPLTQQPKGQSMIKKAKTVKDKGVSKLAQIDPGYQLAESDRENQLVTIRKAIGSELFEAVMAELGSDASILQIQSHLDKLLS